MIKNLLLLLGISLAINIVLFLIAFWKQSDKLTDFSYALSFASLVAAALVLDKNVGALQIILSCMVGLWALRLGTFLVIRVRKVGKDSRFDDRRADFIKFARFWIGQAVVAWVLLLPILLLVEVSTHITILSIIGIAIWLVGLVIETIADAQKYAFKQDPNNEGKWIDSGLWAKSRHPNYFGEITIWTGIFIATISSLNGWALVVAATSPLTIYFVLRYISGVPPLEKYADDKWGNDPAYQAYKSKTKLLLPL